MKKILLFAVLSVFSFLLFSFVNFSINPKDWSFYSRLFFAFIDVFILTTLYKEEINL